MANNHVLAYARVSSAQQNEARQLEALANAGGYDQLFVEKLSAKDRNRPHLAAMLAQVRGGDTVRVKSIDRLARSTSDLLDIVKELNEKNVAVEFIDNPEMNIGSAQGKFMLTVMAAFAELERSTIEERRNEGIAIAKANGAFKKKKALTDEQVNDARGRKASGEKVADIAAEFGVSRQTLYTALKAA